MKFLPEPGANRIALNGSRKIQISNRILTGAISTSNSKKLPEERGKEKLNLSFHIYTFLFKVAKNCVLYFDI